MRRFIALAIRRPTAVAMFALAVVFTGVASFTRLPLSLTPEVSFPKLSVVTSWPQASPETVEAFVTSAVEGVANTVSRVRKVDSVSEEGKSTVNIEFRRGTDMEFAALELSEKLSLLRKELPYGVRSPQIQKYVPEEFQSGRFLSFHLTGKMPLPDIRRFALQHLRGPLLAVDGVADVQVFGGQDPQLLIELDPAKMRAFGVSEEQVEQSLRDLNLRMAAGKLRHQGRTFDLMVVEPLRGLQEIEQAILSGTGATAVRIRDVATVTRGYAVPRSLTRIDGNPAVVLNIEKEVGTNTIKVADRVFARLEELKKGFPPSLRLIKERDQSERIRRELRNLSSRAAFCVAVIFLVLLLFLRKWSTPLIILSSIFISVLLTVDLFYFTNTGLNLLTLAGLALGFGMMVDNSIVVLDNIYRCRQTEQDVHAAALRGAQEVALPIIASTLTTVAAFIPFLYLTGELRIYYLPFTIAVGLALLASLLVAFTLTPAFAVRVLAKRRATSHEAPRDATSGTLFAQLLGFTLRHKLLTTAAVLLLFAGSAHLFDKYVTKGRIWAWGEDTYLVVFVNMPTGSEIERTDAIARQFEAAVVGNPGVARVFTTVSADFARLEITFPEAERYSAFPLILKEQLTARAVETAGPEVGVYGFGPGFYSGGGAAPQYRLELLGYSYGEVKRLAREIGRKLQRNPRVRDVDTNSSYRWRARDDLFEIALRVDRRKLQRFRLSSSDLLHTLESYLRESLDWHRIKLAGKEIDYRIKMAGHRDFQMADMQSLVIETPTHEQVRLDQVATIGERKVLAEIVRQNQQYLRGISFEYRGPWKYGDRLVKSIIENTHLPPGYKLQRARFFFLTEEQKSQIYLVFALAVLLVYMVTAALFESWSQPFVVILTVPLALIGVFLIFFFLDLNFDRSAYIGVILLAGIVVNNSIILVHHINDQRRAGLPLQAAVIRGTRDRVRPILMTSATTILGLLPLVLFSRAEKSIWYALSVATIGGMLSSTLLVLLVTPVAYVILARFARSGGGDGLEPQRLRGI